MTLREWYRVQAKAGDDAADLYIFDLIGKSFWDDEAVSQAKFLADVRALPDSIKTIRLHVSSPGGNPFDAVTMANTLRNEVRQRGRRIEVSIEGLAASAASVVAMAGDVVRMADNALLMIHEASAFAIGSKADLRQTAEMLDAVDRQIVATYRWQSELSEDEIAALMAATTWMDAETARANGFVDEVVPGMAAVAMFRPAAVAALGTIPETYQPQLAALTTPPPPQPQASADPKAVITACKREGFLDLADDLVGQPMAVVEARLTEAKAARTVAEARASEISGLCTLAKLPQLADGLVASGMTAAQVKAHLTIVAAAAAGGEIDNQQRPETDTDRGWARAITKVQGTRPKGA